MTTVTLYRNEEDKYFGFEASGHAGFARFGKDIVCSAVSALTITFVNSIDELTSSDVSVESDDKSGYMKVTVGDFDKDDVQLLFKSLVLGLTGIQDEYSKYLKLTNRRCKP